MYWGDGQVHGNGLHGLHEPESSNFFITSRSHRLVCLLVPGTNGGAGSKTGVLKE